MAKEKEKTTETNTEKYYITDKALREGYSATIDGVKLSVSKAVYVDGYNDSNEPVRILKSAGVIENGKANGNDYFENLTDVQVWELAHAGVIKLSKEQEVKFKQTFYKQ